MPYQRVSFTLSCSGLQLVFQSSDRRQGVYRGPLRDAFLTLVRVPASEVVHSLKDIPEAIPEFKVEHMLASVSVS